MEKNVILFLLLLFLVWMLATKSKSSMPKSQDDDATWDSWIASSIKTSYKELTDGDIGMDDSSLVDLVRNDYKQCKIHDDEEACKNDDENRCVWDPSQSRCDSTFLLGGVVNATDGMDPMERMAVDSVFRFYVEDGLKANHSSSVSVVQKDTDGNVISEENVTRDEALAIIQEASPEEPDPEEPGPEEPDPGANNKLCPTLQYQDLCMPKDQSLIWKRGEGFRLVYLEGGEQETCPDGQVMRRRTCAPKNKKWKLTLG